MATYSIFGLKNPVSLPRGPWIGQPGRTPVVMVVRMHARAPVTLVTSRTTRPTIPLGHPVKSLVAFNPGGGGGGGSVGYAS